MRITDNTIAEFEIDREIDLSLWSSIATNVLDHCDGPFTKQQKHIVNVVMRNTMANYILEGIK